MHVTERMVLQKLLGLFIKANEGEFMSHDYSAIKNKQQKHPKVDFAQYLFNATEPQDDVAGDSMIENEIKLFEDSSLMRHSFRKIAQRLRNR